MPRPVVLTMHPKTEEVWRDRVPDASDAIEIPVKTEPLGWHRRMDPDQWDQAYASMLRGVHEVQKHPGAAISVVAAAPYALGLLLGRRLEAHATLSVYQHDARQPEGKRWICWGPDGQPEPATPGPVFRPLDGLDRGVRDEVRDVAFVMEITLPIFDAVQRALPELGLKGVPMVNLSLPEIGGQSMSAASANAAEQEVWAALERLRERYPNARIHLFYAGPLALLIRVGRRVHIGVQQIICYEFGDDSRYHPRVRLPDGAPLWRDAAAFQEPVTVEHLPEHGSNSRAGGKMFNIKRFDIETSRIEIPPPPDDLERDLAWLLNDRLNNGPADPDNRARAKEIEEALLTWAERAGRALEPSQGGALRGPIELALASPGSEVARWPWEWVKRPTGEALGTLVPIWRCLPATTVRPPPAGPLTGGPLRVLLAIARGASNETRDDVGYRNVARSLLEVARLDGRELEVEVLPRPCTLKTLSARLHDRSRPVHVLHIDGHGVPGQLCLEDPQLNARPVTAEELANAVASASLRAVVMNACHSAARGPGCPLDDVAVELHRRGVPAVVGMQAAARVDAATAFAWAFYESLTRTGRIDLATMEGRAALARAAERDCGGSAFTLPDWGVPVLYLRRGGEALRDPWPLERASRPLSGPRRAPMDWMVQQLDRALATSTDGAMLLQGTLGSGKSTLLREATLWWEQAWRGALQIQTVDGEIPEDEPAPGAVALARLREARGALRPDPGVRLLVWDSVDKAQPWRWSGEERRALEEEIEAMAEAGERLLMAGRDRLRWLQRVHRLPMEGLKMREARELGRARIRARPDTRLEGAATALDAVERVGEIAASNPACLDGMLRAVIQGWPPTAPAYLKRQDLPDPCLPTYEELDASLASVRDGLSPALLRGLSQRLTRGRAELRVDREDARRGGPLDLLERAGAIAHWPEAGAPDVRYRIHPLLPTWLDAQTAGI